MRIIPFLASLAAACACLPTFANTYHITDLGEASNAYGINKANHVAGGYQHSHAALYADGQWKRYTDKSAFAGALDQNDNMLGHDKVGPQTFEPMYYDHTKTTGTPIPLPNGGKTTGPWDAVGGISADGKYVVGPYTHNGYTACFQWTPGQPVARDIGIPAGYQWCEANAVNKSGVIAGEVEDSAGQHAYLYSGGHFNVVGGVDTVFYGINGHGHAVGSTGFPFTTGTFWNGSQLLTLPTQGALSMSVAVAVNSTDVIVGQGIDGEEYTCMMYAQGVLTDLQEVLSNPGEWDLNDCQDINDAGVIVGNGFIGGRQHGFMLTPD